MIPRYVIHNAIIKHHLIKHGFNNPPSSLKDVWYYDITLHKIIVEEA